jgi:ATP-dependent DNA helicase RecG
MPTNTQKQPSTTLAVNRIVIGDVGSGKTIVAFVLALNYLFGLENSQVALIAPTEVLAYQHYQKLFQLKESQLESLNWLDCIYLSGKGAYLNGEKLTPQKFKKSLSEKLANNHKLFWVGTHALLFSDEIRPDIVMVDEQHRFGVKQRAKLAKATEDISPHFISFTATPIPRTLALTFYDSLKPSFLESLEGRNTISTSIESFDRLQTNIFGQIKQILEIGKKVYVICPAVEESDDEAKKSLWSITKTTKLLKSFFGENVLSVHGKMATKKDIISEFKESVDKNILVATTVVEVGVDVGEATLMVILNAERFGLSALHQIRGRVGRNNYDNNKCILVTEKEFIQSKRLKYLCEISDGFALAQKDLELRGSGNIVGAMQSGFGDDLDSIIGLNPELYENIKEVVDKIDFENLEELPRLKNYLQKEALAVWEE